MQLTIISGLSGAGKSVALHTLEDEGHYCIDNLPSSMLVDLANKMYRDTETYERVAVGIDARGENDLLSQFKSILSQVKSCLLYTSPSPRDGLLSRMPSSA